MNITIESTGETHEGQLIWKVIVDGQVVCSLYGSAAAIGAVAVAKVFVLRNRVAAEVNEFCNRKEENKCIAS